jgi:soluble cytochrome b562
MEAINRNLRKLTRQYADPAQKASSLEIVATLQKSAEASKTNFPEKAEKMPEDDKAKYIALFTKDMEALSKQLADLKTAIEAGDNDKAKAQLDALNQLKNSSHKELGVKEDRRGGPGGRGGRGGPGGPGGPEGGRLQPGNDSISAGGAQAHPSQPVGSSPVPASTPASSPQP